MSNHERSFIIISQNQTMKHKTRGPIESCDFPTVIDRKRSSLLGVKSSVGPLDAKVEHYPVECDTWC
ncbi:hypothetical protein DNTS_002194 [Danionella cerebrum]|uniref:Uncharacterized protein n=1 Tax=Danionella cerebrum TaxID=2873325 RepID=A0A553QAG5_9TELE|nr:hypothetical protein DNTS_002194 [Danionella translucida]